MLITLIFSESADMLEISLINAIITVDVKMNDVFVWGSTVCGVASGTKATSSTGSN